MERTTKLNNKSIRRDLECAVIAVNNCLTGVVHTMDYITLLRNMGPSYRADFAYLLRDSGLITKEQSSEFVRLVR